MSEVIPSKLKLVILPTRNPSPETMADYTKAYKCWRSVWGTALKEEMNVKDELYSDNFSRHNHILAVFYDEKIVGLMTLNYMHLSDPVALDDSYFKVWPEITLARLKASAEKIIVTGSFTIDYQFRDNHFDVCWKSLVCASLVRYIKSTDCDCAVATPRLERSVEKICYGTGAIPLQKNLPYSIPGQRIDLVSWSRNIDPKNLDPKIWSLVNYMWNNNTIIIDKIQKGEKNAA